MLYRWCDLQSWGSFTCFSHQESPFQASGGLPMWGKLGTVGPGSDAGCTSPVHVDFGFWIELLQWPLLLRRNCVCCCVMHVFLYCICCKLKAVRKDWTHVRCIGAFWVRFSFSNFSIQSLRKLVLWPRACLAWIHSWKKAPTTWAARTFRARDR